MRGGAWNACLGGALLALSLLTACRDAVEGGSTGGTALYVFDGGSSATSRVLVWSDLDTLAAAPATAPDREISGTLLDDVKTLAWGGMAFDQVGSRLFLVSQTGKVVRIERARTAQGSLSSTSDIASFTLDSSDRLSGGVFSQASVDPQTGTLYVAEHSTSASASQIWVIANPGAIANGGTVSLQALSTSGDTGGTGVAAAAGTVYGFFDGGSTVTDPLNTQLSGPRLRSGGASGWTRVLVGSATRLGAGSAGSLAYDLSGQRLFVSRIDAGQPAGSGPVLIFSPSDFTSGYDREPSGGSLGSWAGQPGLRILAHGGTKDWLVGASDGAQSGAVPYRFFLWKAPVAGASPVTVDLATTAVIRGLALDGNN